MPPREKPLRGSLTREGLPHKPSSDAHPEPSGASVRDYYYTHFRELNPDKKFHFATRIKNYFRSHDFDWFFADFTPSQGLTVILADNDFSHVNKAEARRPYFEKYDHLYAIEAALFRVNHLLNEYNIDLRKEFLQLVPLDQLYTLADALMADDGAILTLSTWAVNVICLTEVLFPRGQNVVRQLAEKALRLDARSRTDNVLDPLLLIYLYTHIILCDSNFYTRPVSEVDLARTMLDRCAEIIAQNFNQLILDVRIEFLVCTNMTYASATTTAEPAANLISPDYPELRARIAAECRQNLAGNSYIIDRRRPASYHTLNGAEHTNVLFIMSGLDANNATLAAQ